MCCTERYINVEKREKNLFLFNFPVALSLSFGFLKVAPYSFVTQISILVCLRRPEFLQTDPAVTFPVA